MIQKLFPLFKIILLLIYLPMSILYVNAAYIENIPKVVINPDGTEIHCFASGDEYYNFLHDAEGFTIIQDKDGYYYYAINDENGEVIPSKHRVSQSEPASFGITPHVKIPYDEYQKRVEGFWHGVDDRKGRAPHVGTINNLVVYIRFSDDTEFDISRSDYDLQFNPGNEVSLKNYFKEVSYGKLNITSHHFPFLEDQTLNLSYQDFNPRAYYQPYNETTNPIGFTGGNSGNQRTYREHTLLQNAINAIAGEIPTDLIIDSDNDGYIDNICFIIRGNSGDWADLLWAHRWVLYSYYVTINGKRVWDYTFQPENQTGVYVIAHEMFHTLGAPDLYRYSQDGFTPVGPWDLMSSGFVHMGAFMKWKYANGNWIDEIPIITEPGDYTLSPLTSNKNNAYRINSPMSSTEYFIVEYRKKEGLYESNLPGSGMLVYRINQSANGNASGPPDEVYIYRPYGNTSSNGILNSAAFSSNAGRTTINDSTNPSSFLSNGSPGGLDIANITSTDETISFTVLEKHYLNVSALPTAGGSVVDQTNTGPYYSGTEISIQAAPNANYEFIKWTIDGDSISNLNPLTVTMPNENVDIIGHFAWVTSTNTQIVSNSIVYPNPFSDIIFLSNALGVEHVTISNLIGSELLNISVNSNSQFEIITSHFQSGIYLITIRMSDGNKIIRRMIKQ
jgi:M6 family metalloprotease-like protein